MSTRAIMMILSSALAGLVSVFVICIGVPAAHAEQAEPAAQTAPNLMGAAPSEMAQQAANTLSTIKLRYAFQLYGQQRDTGSGPNGTDSTTDIYFRRDRLMLSGQVTDVYGFYAAMQFQGDQRLFPQSTTDTPQKDYDVLDTYLYADFTDAFRMRAGLAKDSLIREDNESCFEPLSLDRSYFANTNLRRGNRDFGVILWGNIADALLQYRVAAMEGNDDINDPKSTLRYTARVHASLLDPEASLSYKGSYLGKKKVLTIGAGYQTESDAVYGDVAGKDLVKDYTAYTYDVYLELPTPAGTFTASGAYLKTDFDKAYQGPDPDTRSIGRTGEKNGWYAKAAYLLPNNDLQVYGRYEKWRFSELNGITDQQIKWSAVGVNYYVNGQNLRLTLEYSMNDYETEDALNKNFNTTTLMLQMII